MSSTQAHIPPANAHARGGLHRPSVVQVIEDEPDRNISMSSINCTIAQTPYPILVMKPFAPHSMVTRHHPFVPRTTFLGAINGIRAIQRLKELGKMAETAELHPLVYPIGQGPQQKEKKLRAELVVITGHVGGHLVLWNAENLTHVSAAQHFNSVSVTNCVVTNTLIYTIVERDQQHGKVGDDTDAYVWDMNSMQMLHKLSAHEERITAIVVDEDDEKISITGGADRVIYLWHLDNLPAPLAKITGHNAAISKMLLSSDILVSGSTDGMLRVWNVSDHHNPRATAANDTHGGGLSLLAWRTTHKEARRLARKQRQAQNNGGDDDNEDAMTVALAVSACVSGSTRLYGIDLNGNMVQHWLNKPHKAAVSDVCWDNNIYFSCTIVDGSVNFYHSKLNINTKVAASDSGVRRLAVDPTRKLLIAGSESGLVCIWSYQQFEESPADTTHDTITIFALLHPHLGAVTGMLLEANSAGHWERVITTSSDHSVFVMDFDINRDARIFNGCGTKHIDLISKTGNVLLQNENTVNVWDPVRKKQKELSRKAFLGHTQRVTSLVYSEELSKVITGSDDGSLRTWDILFFESNADFADTSVDAAHDEAIETGDCVELAGAVRCLSRPSDKYVAVGTQKLITNGFSKQGFVELVDFERGTQVCQPLQVSTYPYDVKLLFDADEPDLNERVVQLLVQLRNGEVHLGAVTAPSTDRKVVTPLRCISEELFPFAVELEATTPPPQTMIVEHNRKFAPPKVNMITIDPDRRCVRCVDMTPRGGREPSIAALWTAKFEADVVDMCSIKVGKIHIAVCLENASTVFLTNSGEAVLVVGYDGSVIDHDEEFGNRQPKHRRCFVRLQNDADYPSTSAVSLCPEQKCVGIGYRDGILNIFDLATRRVCRRICAHATAINKIMMLPQQRVMSCSVMGAMRIDPVYGRHIRASGNSVETRM